MRESLPPYSQSTQSVLHLFTSLTLSVSLSLSFSHCLIPSFPIYWLKRIRKSISLPLEQLISQTIFVFMVFLGLYPDKKRI